MKKIITLFVLLASLTGYGQTNVTYSKNAAGEIIATIDLENNTATLPLTLTFKRANFIGKTFQINTAAGVLLNAKLSFTFGQAPLDKPGDYVIDIDEEGLVAPTDYIITKDKLQFVLDGKAINNITLGEAGKTKVADETEYQAGYLFYDAMVLADANEGNGKKIGILESYGITSQTTLDANPFFKDILIYPTIPHSADVKSLVSNLGNLDVTYLAAGIGSFLVERAKTELNEAFFKKMKEQLELYPELTTVFPTTTEFLKTIETYSYVSILPTLKDAFERDINNLPANLYKLTELDINMCNPSMSAKECSNTNKRLADLKKFFKDNPYGRWAAVGLFTLKEAPNATNPAELIKLVATSAELNTINSVDPNAAADANAYIHRDVASTILLGNMLSQSLISKEEGQIWVTPKQLQEFVKKKDAMRIYAGLLLEVAKKQPITFYKDKNTSIKFDKLLTAVGDSLNSNKVKRFEEFKKLITSLVSAYNNANTATKALKDAINNSKEAPPQAIYNYYHVFIESLYPIVHNPIIVEHTGNIVAEYDKIESYVTPSVNIVYDIYTKKYSTAIHEASMLLSNAAGKAFEDKKVAKSFIKYGTLISSVASAQSSEDVSKALEASVLPAGSYAIKRKSRFSISANAYVGGYYGWAYTKEGHYRTYGVTAPIGVSFSCGFRNSYGTGMSLTTQLFDVGALANFYMVNGTEAALPEKFTVRLSNIFAPGVKLGFGIPCTPLVLSYGFQVVPALNSIEQINGEEIKGNSAIRHNFSLLIDIPLFNLKVWDFKK